MGKEVEWVKRILDETAETAQKVIAETSLSLDRVAAVLDSPLCYSIDEHCIEVRALENARLELCV